MKIINYNKIDHDIYTFANEDTMVLCSRPTNVNEVPPGTRTHATVTGWNGAGLWNNNIDNAGIPDWSGLSARSRGSNLYATPTYNLRWSLWDEFNGGSSDPKFSDITNWNNGIPVYIIISKKHFIACAHFTGTNTTQSFDILNKNGLMYSIAGQLISKEGDTNLYRITSINGTDETEITPDYKIKIYEILNITNVYPSQNNWEGLRIWHQLNNGMFVTTTLFNGQIAYNNARQGDPTTGLPILSSTHTIWTGDSGSPILATYNGETYLIGMSDGGHPDYSHPSVFPWLQFNLLADGIIKTLVDQVISNTAPSPMSIGPYNSRFNLDINFDNTQFTYINMAYHGFYGGTSLQSQELNEIQENFQNQLSLANTMLSTYLQYTENINTSSMIDYMNNPTLIPVNPI